MGERLIAMRYAKALFELGCEEGLEDRYMKELTVLVNSCIAATEWVSMLDDEKLSFSKKETMINELSKKAEFNTNITNFLKLLAKRYHLNLLADIADEYRKRLAQKKGEVFATAIVSSEEVWNELKDDIKSTIAHIRGKDPIVDFRIDPSLIGGVMLKVGDKIYDGSIKGEIKALKEKLLQGDSDGY